MIEDDLAAGITIVVDRYYYSGCVYSAAKNVPGLDLRWARCPEVGLPQPDVCIFLDISPEEAAKRGGYGQERYEKKQLQDKVRQLFHELRELDASEPFRLVDAGRSASLVERDVCATVLECVETVAREDPRTALRRVRPLNAQDLSSDLVSCDRAKDLSPSQRSNAAGSTGNSDEGPISQTDHE